MPNPFTLRVTGITRKNAIAESLDHQMPVIKLKGANGRRRYASSKEIVKRHLPPIPIIKVCVWIVGVREGVAKYF